jgi:hypothetical protein
MSAFLPGAPHAAPSDPERSSLRQRPLSPAERRGRWEVRAAQWRARAIAERVFGHVTDTSLLGMRPDGPLRGLVRMSVPFLGLPDHLAKQERFLAAVRDDPVLSRVRLVYVLGPDTA